MGGETDALAAVWGWPLQALSSGAGKSREHSKGLNLVECGHKIEFGGMIIHVRCIFTKSKSIEPDGLPLSFRAGRMARVY